MIQKTVLVFRIVKVVLDKVKLFLKRGFQNKQNLLPFGTAIVASRAKPPRIRATLRLQRLPTIRSDIWVSMVAGISTAPDMT